MQVYLPFSAYYPADDSKFIDPMYVPYETTVAPTPGTNGQCVHKERKYPLRINSLMVSPGEVRAGWGHDFLKMYPSDPCPKGWVDVGDGFCTREYTQGQESEFSTPKHFAAKYQYFNSYTVGPRDRARIDKLKDLDVKNSQPFLNRSVNPYTGHYVVYYDPIPPKSSTKYGISPSRFSYLGK